MFPGLWIATVLLMWLQDRQVPLEVLAGITLLAALELLAYITVYLERIKK